MRISSAATIVKRQVCRKTVGFNMTGHPLEEERAVINFVRPKMEQMRVDSRALFGDGLEVPASLDIIKL